MTMPARTDAGHRIRSWGPKFPSIPPLPDPIDQRAEEKKNQQQQQLRDEAQNGNTYASQNPAFPIHW